MNTTQLGFTYDSLGYMLTYKGKNIGGACVVPSGRVRRNGAIKAADLQMHHTCAKVCVDDIRAGRGQQRFLDVIAKIDGANT